MVGNEERVNVALATLGALVCCQHPEDWVSTTGGFPMFLRINSSMAGSLPHGGTYDLQVGTLVDWSHDKAEAQRLVDRGYGEEISAPRAAEMTAAGIRILKHPLVAANKRK